MDMKIPKIDYIPRYTYDDYVKWEGRWELIQGIPYAMTPLPTIEHQIVSNNINIQLSELLKGCGKCKVLLPVDWKIDDDTILQPDISVICEEVKGKYLTKSPIMIFEVTSPSTAFKDRNIKYKIYESQRVKYYTILDIDAKMAEVFELDKEGYKKLKDTQSDVITFDLGYCSIDFDVEKIWKI
jgi:Uma2 family endonuclease